MHFTKFQPWFDTRNDATAVYKLQEKVFEMKTSATTWPCGARQPRSLRWRNSLKSPWTTNGSRHFLDNGDDVWRRWISTPCGLRCFRLLCSPTKEETEEIKKHSKIGWLSMVPTSTVERLDAANLLKCFCFLADKELLLYEKDTNKKTWLKRCQSPKKTLPGIETFGSEDNELNRYGVMMEV